MRFVFSKYGPHTFESRPPFFRPPLRPLTVLVAALTVWTYWPK